MRHTTMAASVAGPEAGGGVPEEVRLPGASRKIMVGTPEGPASRGREHDLERESSVGNPHARFDARGGETWSRGRLWLRHSGESRWSPILPPLTSAPLLDSTARALCKHLPLRLNWFRSGRAHSSGAVKGLSGEAKLALRKAYGFKSYGAYELALYHSLGDLPEHDLAHSFC